MNNHENLLINLYYKQHNYDGVNELYRKAKMIDKTIKKDFVSSWLKKQSTHQQTTIKSIKKVSYLPIYSESYYDFQIDLTFLPKYKSQNKNNYVLFTAINVNSRYAYGYYGKNKEESTIIEMLENFKHNAIEIDNITCDYGKEFVNKNIKKWFEENNIHVTYVNDDNHNKLGIINRFHRTLKDKLNKYFIANDNTNWIDIIDEIIKNYNNTRNRGIYNFTPKQASKELIQTFIIGEKKKETGNIKVETKDDDEIYKINDNVLLLNNNNCFSKMKIKYSDVIYKIIKMNKNSVDLESNDDIIRNVKKSNIKKVDEVQNYKPNINKKLVEKEHKVERINKKMDILPENIITEKGVRKPIARFT